MRSRWIAASIAVILALADNAWAQSPRGDAYARQQLQDRFLRVVEQLNDTQILFLYPRGSGFTNFLKSGVSSPTRATVRLCDRISGALNEQYLSDVGATREQWSGSFRHMLGNLFKVPVESVDPSKCDIQSLSNADAVVVVGTQAKSLLKGLARDGRLMDSQNLPSIDFYRIGDTVERISNTMVEAARKAAEDRRRREIEEDARRRAELAELAQRTMLELERRAKAGDHTAALRGQELARSVGNRLKEIEFRVLSAESGPASLKLEVASNLLEGTNGLPRDMVGARQLLEQAVKSGYAPAMILLADDLSRPDGFSEDNARAYQLLENAVAAGEPTAAEKLKNLREKVSQNEWHRTEKRLMAYAPWAGLALLLSVSAFVAYTRRHDISRIVASLVGTESAIKRAVATLPYAAATTEYATTTEAITENESTKARGHIARRNNWVPITVAVVAVVASLAIYAGSSSRLSDAKRAIYCIGILAHAQGAAYSGKAGPYHQMQLINASSVAAKQWREQFSWMNGLKEGDRELREIVAEKERADKLTREVSDLWNGVWPKYALVEVDSCYGEFRPAQTTQPSTPKSEVPDRSARDQNIGSSGRSYPSSPDTGACVQQCISTVNQCINGTPGPQCQSVYKDCTDSCLRR